LVRIAIMLAISVILFDWPVAVDLPHIAGNFRISIGGEPALALLLLPVAAFELLVRFGTDDPALSLEGDTIEPHWSVHWDPVPVGAIATVSIEHAPWPGRFVGRVWSLSRCWLELAFEDEATKPLRLPVREIHGGLRAAERFAAAIEVRRDEIRRLT
jgi:hypothetical protein